MATPRTTRPTAPKLSPADGQPSIRGPEDHNPAERAAWLEGWRNVEWVDAHRDEINERYAGHWVCIAKQRVVVADDSDDPNRFGGLVQAGTWNKQGQYVFYVPRPTEWDAIHPGFHDRRA